jgi:hypothetical protein
MKLVLKRRFLGGEYTIGSLYLSPNPSPQGRGANTEVIARADTDVIATTFPPPLWGGAGGEVIAGANTDAIATTFPPPLWGGAGGEVYFCDTLEDVDRGLTQATPLDEIRKIKIPHETAIPTGVYKLIVNLSPAKKRMLPRLLDVPGFSGILIHRGNTKRDSSGCILVGENKVKGKVINSTQYEKRLVEILTKAQENGEEIRIVVGYE